MGKKKSKATTIQIDYNKYEEMDNARKKLGKLQEFDALDFHDILAAIRSEFEGTQETIETKQQELGMAELQGKKFSEMTEQQKENFKQFSKEVTVIRRKEIEVGIPKKLPLSMLKKYRQSEDGDIYKVEEVTEEVEKESKAAFLNFDIIDSFEPIIDREN